MAAPTKAIWSIVLHVWSEIISSGICNNLCRTFRTYSLSGNAISVIVWREYLVLSSLWCVAPFETCSELSKEGAAAIPFITRKRFWIQSAFKTKALPTSFSSHFWSASSQPQIHHILKVHAPQEYPIFSVQSSVPARNEIKCSPEKHWLISCWKQWHQANTDKYEVCAWMQRT